LRIFKAFALGLCLAMNCNHMVFVPATGQKLTLTDDCFGKSTRGDSLLFEQPSLAELYAQSFHLKNCSNLRSHFSWQRQIIHLSKLSRLRLGWVIGLLANLAAYKWQLWSAVFVGVDFHLVPTIAPVKSPCSPDWV
jgi:hypothetical protein